MSLNLKHSLAGALLMLASFSFGAGVFYVDRDYLGDAPTGDSWFSAFPTLQGAIDAAAAAGGGDVWVKKGVHKPAGDSRNATILMKKGVSLYGGFRGTETALDQRNPKANRTILSGDLGRAAIPTDNAYHVLTGASDIRIDGFTISHGNANAAGEERFGGGLLLPEESRNVTVANCTFERNGAESGGAIHAKSSSLTATNCTFYSNSAETGGAIAALRTSKIYVVDSIFSANYAPTAGGAIALGTDTMALIKDSNFLFNTTDAIGGAIVAVSDRKAGIRLEIHQSIFNGNTAKQNGGALAFRGSISPVVADCVFTKNLSNNGSGAIALESGASVEVTNPKYANNKGATGRGEIGRYDAPSVAATTEPAQQPAPIVAKPKPEPEKVPVYVPKPEPKSPLADVFVHNAQDIKVKLRGIVATADYTVLALGDLTDPRFTEFYRNIEAAAIDYAPKGVGFHYLYRFLRHPENNGYIQPFNRQERARHIKIADS
ncbi:right-handed parallel beta-helix repeat-containing protein, partial [Pontiella sp.]|uniref:right-handed parallel beta-helix repeat-containing protein n=1 Tax=Pontiella sp. TaxID=2837462 RepID=UPI003563B6AE